MKESLVEVYNAKHSSFEYQLLGGRLSIWCGYFGVGFETDRLTYEHFKTLIEHVTQEMYKKVAIKYIERTRSQKILVKKLDDILGGIDCCPDHNPEELIKEIRKILNEEDIFDKA